MYCATGSRLLYPREKVSKSHEPIIIMGLPSCSVLKNPPANAGEVSSIPGVRRSPGEGNGNPLQYSFLRKSHGQGSLSGYSPQGHKKS